MENIFDIEHLIDRSDNTIYEHKPNKELIDKLEKLQQGIEQARRDYYKNNE